MKKKKKNHLNLLQIVRKKKVLYKKVNFLMPYKIKKKLILVNKLKKILKIKKKKLN